MPFPYVFPFAFDWELPSYQIMLNSNLPAIDMGSAATNRYNGLILGYTYLSLDNPANLSGTITSIEIWAHAAMSGVKVGTFYLSDPINLFYKCRDAVTIGNVTAGSKQTFVVSLAVGAGDLIGIYYSGGGISHQVMGGAGLRLRLGDLVTPGSEAPYPLFSGLAMSLYAAFVPPVHDITAYVRSLNIEYGKDAKLPFDLTKANAGTCQLVVNNDDDAFNPENTLSPLYPEVAPRSIIIVEATHLAVVYRLWTGYLESVRPHPKISEQYASLFGVDGLDQLARVPVSVELKESVLSGVAIGKILDAALWDAAKRLLDTGIDTLDLYFTKGDPMALSEIRKLEDAEISFAYVGRDGYFQWEDRHHRLISPHTVSQGTFDNDMVDLPYDYRAQSVFNYIACPVTPHVLSASVKLWEYVDVDSSYSPAGVPSILPGQAKTFVGSFGNFAKDVSNPLVNYPGGAQLPTHEFRANAAADNSGADLTASMTIVLTITSNMIKIEITNPTAGTAYITLLRVWGKLYSDEDMTTMKAEDTASQLAYGKRTLEIAGGDLRSNADVAQAICDFALAKSKSPQPELELEVIGGDDAKIIQILGRTISDRITVIHTRLNVSADYYINKVQLQIGPDLVPRAKWTIVRAANEMFWALGYSTLGETTRLCY